MADRDNTSKARPGRNSVPKGEKLAVIRGSGNVYQDLGIEDADARQLKALLAAEILRIAGQEGSECS